MRFYFLTPIKAARSIFTKKKEKSRILLPFFCGECEFNVVFPRCLFQQVTGGAKQLATCEWASWTCSLGKQSAFFPAKKSKKNSDCDAMFVSTNNDVGWKVMGIWRGTMDGNAHWQIRKK